MSQPFVQIVRTGMANMASVASAFERLGVSSSFVERPADVDRAAAVVLPGVGSFGAAMTQLERSRLIAPLRRRMLDRRPTLAICLGLQLLCTESEESPGVRGLDVLPTRIERFTGRARIPHMGWNDVEPGSQCELLQPGCAYFANSYRLREAPDDWFNASTEYGGRFIAALERGSLLACQFHPELSGGWGMALLQRWLRAAGIAAHEPEVLSC